MLISETQTQIGTGTTTKPAEKVKKPSMYVVVVHNDPFTPRTFVVDVLKRYFNKNEAEATKIMLLAHNYGVGAVGTYTFEIAETKADIANTFSREQGHMLQFSVQDT